MSKLALGYITMDAGDGIPGSILKYCLTTLHNKVDYVVVVDGNLTEKAKEFYRTIPNIVLIDSPWTGRHVDQYYARNSAVNNGDWILAMDDDEFPSPRLLEVAHHIKNYNNYNIFYTPSMTYLAIDGSNNFYRIQEYPDSSDFIARSKRILYKKTNTNYFISSPCGMHVTPTHVANNKLVEMPAGSPDAFFYHMKTVESFILNECIYSVSNTIHESGPQARLLTKEQEVEFDRLIKKYKLANIKHFIEVTKNNNWPEEFTQFIYQFKHHLGQSMSKFYYLNEYISKKNFTDTKGLLDCISKGFYPVYKKYLDLNEAPIQINRTPSIWL